MEFHDKASEENCGKSPVQRPRKFIRGSGDTKSKEKRKTGTLLNRLLCLPVFFTLAEDATFLKGVFMPSSPFSFIFKMDNTGTRDWLWAK